MVRLGLAVVALVAAVALFGGVSAADGNEPPLAEAGLDQTVDNGTTVYLDAGGSVDPDGSIASVEWSITDPNGTAVDSSNDASVRTQFTPNRTGTYTANLTVTDDDGATRNDTLYVTVEEVSGPSVGLLGPGQTTPGTRTEFVVNATAGSANLSQLYWMENGSTERSVDLSGDEAMVTVNRSFSETKPYQINATVVDTKGYSQTASLLVNVGSYSGGSGSDRCPDGGSPYFGFDGEFLGCTGSGDADMIYEDRVFEQNEEEGLQLYDNTAGRIVQMMTENQFEELQQGSSGALTRNVVTRTYGGGLGDSYRDAFNTQIPDTGSIEGIPRSSTSSSSESGSSDSSSSTDTSLPPIDSNPPPSTRRYA